MKIPCQSDKYDLPPGVTYLNCAYAAPQLRAITEAGQKAVALKAQPWSLSELFFEPVERIRTLVARILGADAEGVALVPAVSYGLSVAARNIPFSRGQNIVVLAEQFPSNVYPWREMARQSEGEVRTVPRPADGNWTPAVLAAIDAKTALVALPHCHWTDGTVVDLVAVGKKVRAVKAALVIDASQSLGAFRFPMEAEPDFVVAVGYKWLLGPYASAFLWVAPRFRNGTPIEYNWINRKGSEDFSALVSYQDDYAPGARRYDVGEKSSFIHVPMIECALTHIVDWGISSIEETLRDLTRFLETESRKLGFEVVSEPIRAPHMLGLRHTSAGPQLAKQLSDQRIFVSFRGNSIRVSPHLYNTQVDCERLLSALKSF